MSFDKGMRASSLQKDGVPQEESFHKILFILFLPTYSKRREIEIEEVFEHSMNAELVTVVLLLV